MKVTAMTKKTILDPNKFIFRKNTILFGDLITDYDMASNMKSECLLGNDYIIILYQDIYDFFF